MPSTHGIAGSLPSHQHSDVDLLDAVKMGKGSPWKNLADPIYATKDFAIYRPQQQKPSLSVYYVEGRLPCSADTLFNTIADVRYRQQWDQLAKEVTELDAATGCGSDVVYFAAHSPWPLAKRDYVYQRQTKYFAKQNAFVMISQAIPHAQAQPESCDFVRVESFTMRLSIRSTGTTSCSFYMEYAGETNLSIPNFAVNWLLRANVPRFLSELRKACANYASYVKTLSDAAAQTTPASLARLRAEELQSQSFSLEPDADEKASRHSPFPGSNSSGPSSDRPERRDPQRRSESDVSSDTELPVAPERARRRDKFFRRTSRKKPLSSVSKTPSTTRPTSSNRPLASRSPSSVDGVTFESHTVINCLFSCDGIDLLTLFRPFDGDANTGAVLTCPLEGKQVTKQHVQNSTGSTNQCVNAIVPEGAVLNEIDGCIVAKLAFAKIIHQLSRNANMKVLSFKAELRSVDDRDHHISRRRALSRKLSSVFRRKASDDIATASPTSKSPKRVKSASPTSANNDPQSPGQDTKCSRDYSEVTITASNISWAWEHVLFLKADERVFSAATLIEKIEAFLAASDVESAAVNAVVDKMHEERELIELIKERRALGVNALHEFNNEEEAEWNFAQTYFGVSTHWKPGADGTVWLKLEGLVEGVDSFNTLSVIREIDLFKLWAPFCNQSTLLHQTGFTDVHAYMSIALPLLKRDLVLRAVGINACYENRCILLLGESVDDDQLPNNVEAPRLKDWNADRAELHAFRVLIEPITRTKSRACLVCNVDPKCPVPKSLLNFCIKKMAGVMLYLIRKEAEKIEKAMQDGTNNDHVTRIHEDPEGFYAWLRPLFGQWFEDQRANRLPPLLKYPTPSELDERNHAMSVASSSRLLQSSTSSKANVVRKPRSQSRPYQQKSSRPARNLTASAVVVSDKKTWASYLYGFGIWPWIVLVVLFRVM